MKEKSVPDLLLITVLLIFLGLGLITVYSSSAIYAYEKYGNEKYFLWRQIAWAAIGLAAAAFFTLTDHRKIQKWVNPILLTTLACLIFVLLVGKEVGGARRWIKIAGIGFQPSEFAKLAVIFFVASYCDRKKSKLENFRKGILPLLLVVAAVCGLILLQPDFGTAFLIFLTCMTMIFISGGNLKQILILGLVTAPLAAAAVWLEPYRRRRLLAFLNPWENPQGSSYQIVQSILALGSGGLTGVGLGDSHSKLLYLPEPHTDFIFPIFGEEFGLVGSWAVIGLFGVLATLGFRIAARSANLFSSLLAGGITAMILYQAILNIAMVTGCLPPKGFPLPFFSFGGSSLLVTLSAAGILLNISRSAKRATNASVL
ncbi:MAG: cell division protein FtsW [Elusimicrobia bacterium RIFCSPLOWO2_01_FULL_54_10]|nr:MAG: cell division protein FtsW [Elusimicrobia bacterium RIFCSPLOWO2_01_FULL_54_10]